MEAGAAEVHSVLAANIKRQAGQANSSAVVGAAERWFLDSGIQSASGGVARYYRQDTRETAPISSEISGYFATALFMLHDLSGSNESFEAALRAADFLAKAAWDEGSDMLILEQSPEGRTVAYFFDCGIVVSALLEAWRRAGNAEHRRAAFRLGESMLKDFAGESGRFHPVVKTSTRNPLEYGSWWSKRPGCYQLKAAKAWLELSEEMNSIAFRNGYESVLDYAMLDDAGFLNAADQSPDTMDRLHAYGYFLEGLLPVADRGEPGRSLAEGIERMSSVLPRVGPIFARSDVCAQLLRLRLLANEIGLKELDEAYAEQEAATIREFQVASGDHRVNGAFAFGRRHGQLMPVMSPVSTSFCVQALTMWEEYKGDRLSTDWRKII
ncbi:MAG: hypothetical protein WA324_11075 [Bryobacteraceae bacterium]